MNEESARPDPDELLGRIEAEEKKAKRGRLKIFFGSSAGVGKTYAMLSAAREQMEQGRNVLAGIVETHGRPETERLLEGLLILPPREIGYRGVRLKELDLDAALTRKPEILLVDELAHTNAPGSRHPKRWNDVAELLSAGIDVYTTLNVQHIESLSDLVAGTTGVWMKETVPDSIFDLAEDIVLVDIDEDDLIKRLNEGKVYVAPGAQARAAEHFFRKSNLSALREIALRRMAERVDAERESLSSHEPQLALSEKILVCVALDSLSLKLIRSAKRMATALKAPWTALYVDDTGRAKMTEAQAHRLEALEHMVERMSGRMVALRGDDAVDEIISYAKRGHFSKIVVGRDLRPSLRHFVKGIFVDHIIRRSGFLDVYVVTDDRSVEREPKALLRFPSLAHFAPFDYALTVLTLLGFTIPGLALPDLLTPTDQALLYLTGSVLVASRLGLGPSLFYTVAAAILFNVFFMGFSHTFTLADTSYFITLVVMLVAGLTNARQAARLRAQAMGAREQESRTRALYALSRKLASSRGRFPVSEVAGQYLAQAMSVKATVWMTNSEGLPSVILGDLPEATYYKDFGALQWCFDNAAPAGRGTTTMPSAAGFYLPLVSGTGTLGVVGLFPQDQGRSFTSEETASMETIVSLLASALERVRAGEIAQQIMIEKENAKLRSALVPQRTSGGEATAASFPPLSKLHLDSACPTGPESLTLPQESGLSKRAMTLGQSLKTYFDQESLSQGALDLNRRPTSLLDRIKRVLDRNESRWKSRSFDIRVGAELPDILVDLPLFEQLLEDLLAFAVNRSPRKETLLLEAKRQDSEILLLLTDHGPPLSDLRLERLFDGFLPKTTFGQTNEDALSIPAGIVRLHGGTIAAHNLPQGGLRIELTLPIA